SCTTRAKRTTRATLPRLLVLGVRLVPQGHPPGRSPYLTASNTPAQFLAASLWSSCWTSADTQARPAGPVTHVTRSAPCGADPRGGRHDRPRGLCGDPVYKSCRWTRRRSIGVGELPASVARPAAGFDAPSLVPS